MESGRVVGDEVEEVVSDATQGFGGRERSLDFISGAIRRHGRILRSEII